MNEYFETKAEFCKFYVPSVLSHGEEVKYSRLVDHATYDIGIQFGSSDTDLPTKEMEYGLCTECIKITDLSTNIVYRYSSFNEAFNIWEIDEDEERKLNIIDDMHDTYKEYYPRSIYVIGWSEDDMFKAYSELCKKYCVPILANISLGDLSKTELSRARSIEYNSKILNCSFVLMLTNDGALSPEMEFVYKIAKDHDIPILYSSAPKVAKSYNVSIENSSDVKIEDLDASLDN